MSPALSQPRDFTSLDGRVLRAELLYVNNQDVQVKRVNDGKEFVIPLNTLSLEDQNFLKNLVEEGEIAHPLNWRRLKIHVQNHSKLPSSIYTIISGRQNVNNGYIELYLPEGSWVSFGYQGPSMRYGGESDWYVQTLSREETLIRTELGKEAVMIGGPLAIQYSSPNMLTLEEAKKVTFSGRSFSLQGAEVHLLKEENLSPESLKLSSVSDHNLKHLPPNLLHLVLEGNTDISLSQLEKLKELESLTIRVGNHQITHLGALSSLSKLNSLSIKGSLEKKELSTIGGFKKLEYLELHNEIAPLLPQESYDFIGNLRELKVLQMQDGSNLGQVIDPSILKNCPDLTIANISWLSYEKDKGAFLQYLPKLTEVSFGGGRTSPKIAQKLIDSGNFQHAKTLEAWSGLTFRNMPYLTTLITDGLSTASKGLLKSDSFPYLRVLELRGAQTEIMGEIAIHPSFQTIEKVRVTGHTEFGDLQKLSALPKLKSVFLSSGKSQEPRVLDFGGFKNLEDVSIFYMRSPLTIKRLAHLKELTIYSTPVESIDSGSAKSKLESLELSRVSSLKSLSNLGECSELTVLQLDSCKELEDTGILLESKNLEKIKITNNDNIADILKEN